MSSESSSAPAHPPPRRLAVAAACNACRQRKAKCSGDRPQCSSCARRGALCEYETHTTKETHRQAKERRLNELETRVSLYQELVERIHHGTEQEAIDTYHQIRNGQHLGRSSTTSPIHESHSISADDIEANALASRLLHALIDKPNIESTRFLERLRKGETVEQVIGTAINETQFQPSR